MPLTVPVPVVLAGATPGPVWSGTPSKPSCAWALDESRLDVPVSPAAERAGAAELGVPELELELPRAAGGEGHGAQERRASVGWTRIARKR